jgi:hypothetical protein
VSRVAAVDQVNFLAVAYTDKGTACVAAESGDVYAFVGDRCAKVFNKVMDTAISHLAFYQGGLLLGGAQLVRHVSSTMETVADYACGAGRARCIAVNSATGAFAVGTSLRCVGNLSMPASALEHSRPYLFMCPCVLDKMSARYSEIWLQVAPSAQPNLVAQAHSDGELWAVAVTKSGRVVTAGEDNKIMTWDPQSHRIVSCAPISTKAAGLRRRDPRAATTSLQPQERCVAVVLCGFVCFLYLRLLALLDSHSLVSLTLSLSFFLRQVRPRHHRVARRRAPRHWSEQRVRECVRCAHHGAGDEQGFELVWQAEARGRHRRELDRRLEVLAHGRCARRWHARLGACESGRW